MKKLIAYSSVAHMGFVTMGLFTMTPQGIQGAMFTMISHGLVSGALFLCVGVIYDRMHTREIAAYGGLVNRMPLYALAFMVFTMANVGLPGTSGFVGEFLSLVGAFRANPDRRLPGDYRRHPLRRLRALALSRASSTGGSRNRACKAIADLNAREIAILAPLVILMIFYGVKPGPILDSFAASTDSLDPGLPGRHVADQDCRSAPSLRSAMNPIVTAPAFGPALPEIILAVGVLVLILFGAYRGERSAALVTIGALALLFVALVAVLILPASRTITMGGSFIVDGFAKYMKLLVLLGSAATIALSTDYLRREGIDRFEYPILILLSTIGMLMMVSANDLIGLYLGLELQSLSAYVIASFHRDNLRSTEAGLKYFVLGALSSGMLLYGASLVYGFTGTVAFPGIATALRSPAETGVVLGLVFVAAGVAFKISAVPFHMWTPDVYEGAPTPVTAFFSSAPKVAAMAMTVRVFMGAFPNILGQWQQIIIFIAIASMLLGSFAAIGQRNIKRLMAYSSIGNVGYALIGLAAGTAEGIQGVIVYMAIYLAMTLGGFACILAMCRRRRHVRKHRRSLRLGPDPSGSGLLLRRDAVLARRHPAARRLLRQVLRVRGGDPGRVGDACGHRRRHQRDRRILLRSHRQDHVLR